MSGIVGNNTNRGSGLVKSAAVGADSITGSEIADDAIDSEHYTDGSIDNAHIADNAIDSEHYTDGSIDNAHIADDAVDSDELAAGAVDNAHIDASAAIAWSKLATDAGDTTVTKINLKDYGEITSALGSAGGSRTIDLTTGNSFTATITTGTVTWTFSNPTASDEGCGFTLIQTNGGSQTVNWPGSVDWEGGTAPTLTASGVDILTFWTVDGGTIWHGMIASTDSK